MKKNSFNLPLFFIVAIYSDTKKVPIANTCMLMPTRWNAKQLQEPQMVGTPSTPE